MVAFARNFSSAADLTFLARPGTRLRTSDGLRCTGIDTVGAGCQCQCGQLTPSQGPLETGGPGCVATHRSGRHIVEAVLRLSHPVQGPSARLTHAHA